jgi:hypothetical protein
LLPNLYLSLPQKSSYYNQWLDAEPKFGFSFPAKWLSADGKRFVMVWSGTGKYDTWNTTAGSFLLHDAMSQSPHY